MLCLPEVSSLKQSKAEDVVWWLRLWEFYSLLHHQIKICLMSQAEVFVCESHRKNNMRKPQKPSVYLNTVIYSLDISFKWLLLNNEIRNFHIMRSPSRHTVNPVFSSTKFMAHLALGRGVSLFLSTHVDLLNSWCLYLKSATLECAARGPLTQWSSRTRGACRCLPHVRRSEYKHTRL